MKRYHKKTYQRHPQWVINILGWIIIISIVLSILNYILF